MLIRLTLRPVRHQVHFAVRALPQLAYVLVLFGYVCCRQRGDGQGLHVLHRCPSTVAHFGRGGAPSAAHPSRPRRRKRQARLDTVGQTKTRGQNSGSLCRQQTRMHECVYDNSVRFIYVSVCTAGPRRKLYQEGFNRASFPYNQFRDGINRESAFSKCIGLPAVPVDHSCQLSDIAGLRQHLLADSYGKINMTR